MAYITMGKANIDKQCCHHATDHAYGAILLFYFKYRLIMKTNIN